MNDFVLDASAVLALLQNEPGAGRVRDCLLTARCLLSAVNLSEVYARLSDWNVPVPKAEAAMTGFELESVPFDNQLAGIAAELRATTRHRGLSLGDRACLALAKLCGAVALTADRPWLNLDVGVRIECIR